MALLIGVPRESFPGEKRVATVPEVVLKLIKQGFRVAVEAGAGDAAQISDDAYRAAGAEIVPDRARLWATSDIVFKVRAPDSDEVGLLREGGTLVSFIWPVPHPRSSIDRPGVTRRSSGANSRSFARSRGSVLTWS